MANARVLRARFRSAYSWDPYPAGHLEAVSDVRPNVELHSFVGLWIRVEGPVGLGLMTSTMVILG
ncbi:hypothetical protein CH63R_07076 [Colletotrichum higginsianum IMI 349063]|uniref:Uncharacterized protein n=1 Tax=Colletotrichum higginsianum (strain IMI 349063) TaxID=759273 RepID=A0A1B7Y8C6_COLHI|nr:hypothetical protein CH63R_07076 [Colletotrichum higginsianum IMI 349063]OBR08311.1 hypothetical protein CH63R_07076 [Colletotrichum higginsianum IMI 349063]